MRELRGCSGNKRRRDKPADNMQNAVAALIWLRKQKASETKLTVEGKALFKRALFKGDAVTRGTFGVEGTSSYEKT